MLVSISIINWCQCVLTVFALSSFFIVFDFVLTDSSSYLYYNFSFYQLQIIKQTLQVEKMTDKNKCGNIMAFV